MEVRPATKEDIEGAALILYDSFGEVAKLHDQDPSDFKDMEAARECAVREITDGKEEFGFVVSNGKELVGYGCISNRNHDFTVRGYGPIGVSTKHQAKGIGRMLMTYGVERARREAKEAGIHEKDLILRLTQDCSNPYSFKLYTSIGFRVLDTAISYTTVSLTCSLPKDKQQHSKKLLHELQQKPHLAAVQIRAITASDCDGCVSLAQEIVPTIPRNNELRVLSKCTRVAIDTAQGGKVVGYTHKGINWDSHTVAVSEDIAKLFVLSILSEPFPEEADEELVMNVFPRLHPNFISWVISSGLFRTKRQMNMMGIGPASDPKGFYLPSIEY